MNQIIGFIRLQQIDTRLDQVNARLNQINIMLENDQGLKQIIEQKKSFEQKVISSTKNLELSEQAVQNQLIKIQQSEANLYSGKVKNPKELQDLQTEITILKRFLSSLENKLLEAMIEVEEDQKVYELICSKYIDSEHDYTSRNAVFVEERNLYQKELEKLAAEKKAAENSLTSQDLFLYNKLRMKRGGIAVSTISEGACNSCGATLTPAQEQAVKSPDQMIYCPSCGRMLYAS
ncbi:MAG: hypothetical protein A2X25_11095 [Chloroflexi bacterium GWB2_49_20]|nr:MAG: hypothetical protein A2X25_11095 [Chloroflexi bacterium GWB2_49_20]OGN78901.1 MAG: hypothetical protein A2X26_00260 [Chloroflexi bacterium GWC2_49_37]OGN86338.1 MAG: hypothetical protein A2X27_05520 [Chloroflexi bacterium GWD2_49_16]HBG74570.1 hypothetical protein [Anaerolineae bacterium]